jgi:hypothetical protein
VPTNTQAWSLFEMSLFSTGSSPQSATYQEQANALDTIWLLLTCQVVDLVKGLWIAQGLDEGGCQVLDMA